jgi:hypothetical protein
LPTSLFRWIQELELGVSAESWRRLLGGPLHRSVHVKAHATLSFLLHWCNLFQAYRSLCKRYFCVLLNIASVLSYCFYTCNLNILGTRIETSVLSSQTRVWQKCTSIMIAELSVTRGLASSLVWMGYGLWCSFCGAVWSFVPPLWIILCDTF